MKTLIDYAMQFVGTPYKWGGDDPIEGYDCSGFVQEILMAAGVDPDGDQTAHGLYMYFLTDGDGEYMKFAPGSLSFYGKREKIIHVAFHIDAHRVIEAGGGGSTTKSPRDAARQNAFIRVRHMHARNDWAYTILPEYPSWITPIDPSSYPPFVGYNVTGKLK